jgi:hypothetical protein
MRKLVNELRWTRYVKSAFAIMLVVLVGALSSGCEKDEKDPEPGNNEFAYAGQKSGVVNARQVFYKSDEKGTIMFLFFLLKNNHVLSLTVLMSPEDDELVAGTYVYPSTMNTEIWENTEELPTLYEMKSGTVNVAKTGSKYTVDMEGALTKEKSLKGNYSGTIPWYNYDDMQQEAISSSDFSDKVQLKEALINYLKENASRIQ